MSARREQSYLRAGWRRGEGWFAETHWVHRDGGSHGTEMTGGSFLDFLKFFFVPRRWYVWRYERRCEAERVGGWLPDNERGEPK